MQTEIPCWSYLYNGPHVQLVNNTWLNAAELWMHRLAQQGICIVFSMDGRGSANRGYDSVPSHRRLGDMELQTNGACSARKASLSGTPHDSACDGWIWRFYDDLPMTRPESAGTSRSALWPAAVVDWRMYEIVYTERYMDTPQENRKDTTAHQSLFNHIDNLSGPPADDPRLNRRGGGVATLPALHPESA
ncbi:MAG: hypothetical protein IPM98_22625 [Lewinellaceae bacterium]|nr:hypothetical protein [Lewinellaceae bacterium]